MSLNNQQIIDRGREVTGKNISDQEASQIMNVTGGGDEPQVYAYFRAGRSSASAPSTDQGTTAAQLIQAAIDKYTTMLNDYIAKGKEFDAKNPFVFDDMLAKETEQVRQRLDPYYQQTLGDFLTDVERKRSRGAEDTQSLLGSIQQDVTQFTGDTKTNLDKALENSRNGYADAGLYGSGAQMRDTGATTAASNDRLAGYVQRQNVAADSAVRNNQRLGSDLALSTAQRQRDLGQEESYNTSTQALSETQRLQQQREFEKMQYQGPAPGVTPEQFSSYSLGLLK